MFDLFLENVATALNTSTTGAGIILSLISIAILIAVIGIGSRSGMGILGSGVIGLVFFTAIEWIPRWTGAVLGIIFALMFAQEVRNRF